MSLSANKEISQNNVFILEKKNINLIVMTKIDAYLRNQFGNPGDKCFTIDYPNANDAKRAMKTMKTLRKGRIAVPCDIETGKTEKVYEQKNKLILVLNDK